MPNAAAAVPSVAVTDVAIMTEAPLFLSVQAALRFAFCFCASVPVSAAGKAMREALRAPRFAKAHSAPAGLEGAGQAGMMRAQLERGLNEAERAFVLLRYGSGADPGRGFALGVLAGLAPLVMIGDPLARRRIVQRVLFPGQDAKTGKPRFASDREIVRGLFPGQPEDSGRMTTARRRVRELRAALGELEEAALNAAERVFRASGAL